MKKLLAYFGYYKAYSWAFWVTHKKENILIIVDMKSIRALDGNGKDYPISDAMLFDKEIIDVKDVVFDGYEESLLSNEHLKHWWKMN